MTRDRTTVTGWLLLLLALWLGFIVHQSPRFPGSLWGGVFGVSAAVLMLVPFAYTLLKRVDWLKDKITARLTLSKLLAWHVNASIGGAFLAILHSGHRYQSWLGILLTAAMLLAILSGYIGRYYLRYLSQELRERQESLLALRAAYDRLAAHIAALPQGALERSLISTLRGRVAAAVAGTPRASEPEDLRWRAIGLAEAIADTEYAISADETLKRRLRVWLTVHVAASIAFYVLLALHIWGGIQFGLRWFS